MANVRRSTVRPVSIPGGLAVGVGCALVWTLLGAMITAKLVDMEILAQESIGYGSMIILLSASALGALVSWLRIKKDRVPVCLGTGGIYYLCLLSATALFFGGQYTGMGVTALLVALGSAAVILPGLRGRGGDTRKRYKIGGF